MIANKKLKIAFVLGVFPAISETFIINQIADLKDKDIIVSVFAFKKGKKENISDRYYKYNMPVATKYLEVPDVWLKRIILALPRVFRLLIIKPSVLFKIFNIKKYGRNAWSLKLLFWVEPWIGYENDFDIIHCHFGTIANKFLIIKDILGLKQKIITTFYGYDISHIPKIKGTDYYNKLMKESSLFLVMSENMKKRVIDLGFIEDKIKVHPISIEISKYPYAVRKYKKDDLIRLVSVGRFVEKKGFDDLLKAIAIVKEKSDKSFVCDIVGDGLLKDNLHNLAKNLNVGDVVNFRGYMKLQDIIKLYKKSHIYLQASKTASDGDME